jgi:hypothetical protein
MNYFLCECREEEEEGKKEEERRRRRRWRRWRRTWGQAKRGRNTNRKLL